MRGYDERVCDERILVRFSMLKNKKDNQLR